VAQIYLAPVLIIPTFEVAKPAGFLWRRFITQLDEKVNLAQKILPPFKTATSLSQLSIDMSQISPIF
jgi:hypothetical protein